jgi:hypothetical protein
MKSSFIISEYELKIQVKNSKQKNFHQKKVKDFCQTKLNSHLMTKISSKKREVFFFNLIRAKCFKNFFLYISTVDVFYMGITKNCISM